MRAANLLAVALSDRHRQIRLWTETRATNKQQLLNFDDWTSGLCPHNHKSLLTRRNDPFHVDFCRSRTDICRWHHDAKCLANELFRPSLREMTTAILLGKT